MEHIKTKLHSAKNHIHRNRAKYAVAATTAVAAAAFIARARVWNEFLEEKGLTDEFYALTEED